MNKSKEMFEEAQRYIPGGVNSPVRAFKSVGSTPIYIDRGAGAYLFDVDGKRYIDYVGSWGPMILGHAHPDVLHAVNEAASRGLSFGAPTEIETKVAAKVCELMPAIEKIRMVNSGTEATMSAIRLARAYTERDKIIKFEGCYHGHADSLLVKAGSGALTLGVPTSPGVPASLAANTITLSFNDFPQLQQAFAEMGDEVACVIIEPVAGNMNCILPDTQFIHGLRELCTKHGVVLIFDEVMTGFRVGLGGAQGWQGIRPDLTCLGKIIGGGMPVGAFGGKAEIMDLLAPVGPVYQAGTLSGNPVAMAAGLKTLELISEPGFYAVLSGKTKRLVKGVLKAAEQNNIPLTANWIGGMFGFFFSPEKVTSYAQACACNVERFNQYHALMLERGVYLAPSAFEAGFVSAAHTDEEIDATIEAADKSFSRLNIG